MTHDPKKSKDPLEQTYFMEPGKDDESLAKNCTLLDNLETVMKTRSGRSVIWQIIKISGHGTDIMTGNSWMHYLSGKQGIGNELMTATQTERLLPLYRTMQDEYISSERLKLSQNKEN
jgi:hypothetical protein